MAVAFARFLFFLILLASASDLATGADVSITSENLAELIRNQNLRLAGGEKQVKAMVSRTGHLGRSYLPTMDVHGGAEAFRTGADLGSGVQPYAGVQANWNLFRGGRDYAEGRYRDA